MNNNFYEIPNDWYNEFNNTFNPMNMYNSNNFTNNQKNSSSLSLVKPNLALERGNLFNNLYDPYKNYQYRILKATNKKEELLYSVLSYLFTLQELDLYLDIYPNNQNMINLYNNYLSEYNKYLLEYEKNYGPISLDSPYLKGNSWLWLKSPWPWEGTR